MLTKRDVKASASQLGSQLKSQSSNLARRAGPSSARLAAATKDRATPVARHARAWTADTLDRSSTVVQETLAPKVSSALSATARRVRPASPKRRLLRGLLRALGLLGAAGLAAAMAALAVRHRTAIRNMAAAHLPGLGSTESISTEPASTQETATEPQSAAAGHRTRNGRGTNGHSSASAPSPNAEAGADAGR